MNLLFVLSHLQPSLIIVISWNLHAKPSVCNLHLKHLIVSLWWIDWSRFAREQNKADSEGRFVVFIACTLCDVTKEWVWECFLVDTHFIVAFLISKSLLDRLEGLAHILFVVKLQYQGSLSIIWNLQSVFTKKLHQVLLKDSEAFLPPHNFITQKQKGPIDNWKDHCSVGAAKTESRQSLSTEAGLDSTDTNDLVIKPQGKVSHDQSQCWREGRSPKRPLSNFTAGVMELIKRRPEGWPTATPT